MTNQLMNQDGDFNMAAFDNVPHNQTQAVQKHADMGHNSPSMALRRNSNAQAVSKLRQIKSMPNPNNPYGCHHRFPKHMFQAANQQIVQHVEFNECSSPDSVSITLVKKAD